MRATSGSCRSLPAECQYGVLGDAAGPQHGLHTRQQRHVVGGDKTDAGSGRHQSAVGQLVVGAQHEVLARQSVAQLTRLTTAQLAERLHLWQGDGGDVALWIGGPDGFGVSVKQSADEALPLSDLTPAPAFARVLRVNASARAPSARAPAPSPSPVRASARSVSAVAVGPMACGP